MTLASQPAVALAPRRFHHLPGSRGAPLAMAPWPLMTKLLALP